MTQVRVVWMYFLLTISLYSTYIPETLKKYLDKSWKCDLERAYFTDSPVKNSFLSVQPCKELLQVWLSALMFSGITYSFLYSYHSLLQLLKLTHVVTTLNTCGDYNYSVQKLTDGNYHVAINYCHSST